MSWDWRPSETDACANSCKPVSLDDSERRPLRVLVVSFAMDMHVKRIHTPYTLYSQPGPRDRPCHLLFSLFKKNKGCVARLIATRLFALLQRENIKRCMGSLGDKQSDKTWSYVSWSALMYTLVSSDCVRRLCERGLQICLVLLAKTGLYRNRNLLHIFWGDPGVESKHVTLTGRRGGGVVAPLSPRPLNM